MAMSASSARRQRDQAHDDELVAEELTHVPDGRDGIEYVERARAAGAEGELRYLGGGGQGYVFGDERGHAFKVARFDTPRSHRLLAEEFHWLVDAGQVPEIRRLVAKAYRYHPGLGVLEREEVIGEPMRSWSDESRLSSVHEKISDALKDRWTAPEFKGDSYVRTAYGPVLVDAGFALRRGVLLVEQAVEKLKGHDVGETAEDLSFAIRMESGRTIDPSVAEQLATRLEQLPPERRPNPVRKASMPPMVVELFGTATLYRGWPRDKLAKNELGVLWTTPSLVVAREYATPSYAAEGVVWTLHVEPSMRVFDLRDLSQAPIRALFEATNEARRSGMGAWTEEDWRRHADFGVFEQFSWTASFLRKRRVEAVLVADSLARMGIPHVSVALLNMKAIVSAEKQRVPQASRTIGDIARELAAERQPNPVRPRVREAAVDNTAALAALENEKSRVEAERTELLNRFLPPIADEHPIARRIRFRDLDNAGGVPDWFWKKDEELVERGRRLFDQIWDLRKASGLDPRTGKPLEPPKPRPTISEEGYYPDLLGETSDLFSDCDAPRLLDRRRTADGHREHFECPRGHHHLRYILDDGAVVAGLTLSSEPKKKRAVINTVFTDRAHRRRGYAAALLALARERYTVKHSTTLTDHGKAWARAVNPTTIGNELILWHGGRPWQGPVEVQEGPIRANQHGPGVYLTTSAETARKYAKGGGRVFRFALDPNLVLLDEQRLPVTEMVRWLRDQPRMRNRDKVIHDLHRLANERNTLELPIFFLLNLLVNHDAHGGAHGVAFARWMSQLGIDAQLVSPPGKHDEDWLVLFNPEKVLSTRPARPDELVDTRVRR